MEGNHKQPYFFQRADGKPILLAGLWVTRIFFLLTQEAKGKLSSIHTRRPVALSNDDAREWCDKPLPTLQLFDQALSESEIRFYPVSTRISSPRNDGSDLVEPIALSTQPIHLSPIPCNRQ